MADSPAGYCNFKDPTSKGLATQVEWALNHHNINYKSTTYTPLLGEGWLRRKTGKKEGLITVPVMFTPDGRDQLIFLLFTPALCLHTGKAALWAICMPGVRNAKRLPSPSFV